MAEGTPRPIVLPLSNPTSAAEAIPARHPRVDRRSRDRRDRLAVRRGRARRPAARDRPGEQRVHLPGRRARGDRGRGDGPSPSGCSCSPRGRSPTPSRTSGSRAGRSTRRSTRCATSRARSRRGRHEAVRAGLAGMPGLGRRRAGGRRRRGDVVAGLRAVHAGPGRGAPPRDRDLMAAAGPIAIRGAVLREGGRAGPHRVAGAGRAARRRGPGPDPAVRRLPLRPARPRWRLAAADPRGHGPRGRRGRRGGRARGHGPARRASPSRSPGSSRAACAARCRAGGRGPARTRPSFRHRMLDGATVVRDAGRPATLLSYCGIATMAEATVVPVEAAIPIPDGVDPAVAALIGCCVTTGVGAVLKTAEVPAGRERRGHRARRGRALVRHGRGPRRGLPDRGDRPGRGQARRRPRDRRDGRHPRGRRPGGDRRRRCAT